MLIFEKSRKGRYAYTQVPHEARAITDIDQNYLREDIPSLPEVSELQVVRHYTSLSQKNFCVETNCYPLGSCTMKYNPKGAHHAANVGAFLARHPLAPEAYSQGFMSCLYDLQEILKEVTGMAGVSLTPLGGAQGEFAGISMIHAYHNDHNHKERDEIIVPVAAHGTNPATASMSGYHVKDVAITPDGDVDVESLKSVVGERTAGIMLTNPSTCGVFERRIQDIAKIVHDAGGLLYYDGANFNAIIGKVKPGEMGFDVMHMNLHKTFGTPHGGGGPGSGPIAVGERLLAYMPVPFVQCRPIDNKPYYHWASEQECPKSIGRLSAYMGNASMILRAFAYTLYLGSDGMHRVSEFATLNANYVMKRLEKAGFTIAYPGRRASHEFLISFKKEKAETGISALDIAKRLLDFGFHPPTMYFPLLVPECFLIEPTETECKEDLDRFVDTLIHVRNEIYEKPELIKSAPHTTPVRRLNEVKAARDCDVVWRSNDEYQKNSL